MDFAQPLDERKNVANDPSWSPLRCEKLITFAGGTTDAWGDDGGALDGAAVFTVTGTVRLRVMGIVETTPVGAATIEMGVTGSTAAALPQVANATTMTTGFIWHMTDGTVDSKVEASTVCSEKIVANGADLLLTVGSTNITAGAIRFIVSWYPVSADGNVVPSTN